MPHLGDYTLGGMATAMGEEKMIESRNLASLAMVVWVYFDRGHHKEHIGIVGFVVFNPKG